jgi:preprotein translocase subunit SecB
MKKNFSCTEDKYELLRIYIRNLSVESPLTGRLPQQINQPNIDIDIDPMITRVADNLYEVAARFTVSAHANGVSLYLIELTQAGLFSIPPSGEALKEELLRRVFPQLIYPAARSNIVSFIVAAGYQPMVLDHIRLESLFANTQVADKRQPPPVSIPSVQKEPVAQVINPKPSLKKQVRVRAVALVGAGIIVLLLAIQMDWQRYLTEFLGGHPATRQMLIASKNNTTQPLVTGSVSAVVQNEVLGLPVSQLEQTGSNWLAAQEGGAFTVELLRTEDLKKVENIAPIDEGQPLFLVKLAGDGKTGYAVLSGTYGNEDQAKQAAAKSASYRTVRFSDYR